MTLFLFTHLTHFPRGRYFPILGVGVVEGVRDGAGDKVGVIEGLGVGVDAKETTYRTSSNGRMDAIVESEV